MTDPVVVPDDFAQALAGDRTAGQAFSRMPASHQRRYVEWIEEAKRPETRARRIAKALNMIGGTTG